MDQWDEFQDASPPEPSGDAWAEFADAPAEESAKPKRKAKRARNVYGEVAGFMANVNRGLGIGDEMAAGIATGINALTRQGPQGFRANMAAQRQTEDAFREDRPKVAALGLGTGNALTMAAPVGPGAAAFAGSGRAVNALRGATLAGLTGTGYTALDRGSLKERAQAGARAAYDPVILGLGAGVGAIASRGRPRAQPGPDLETLRHERDAAYGAVEQSGQRYTADQFNGLIQRMAQAADEAGFHAGLHPKTAAMFERLGQSERASGGYAPSLRELDQLRQQIGRDVAGSSDPGERRMGQILREQIDAFVQEAGDSAEITRARDMNTRVRKLEALDGLDDAAADRAATTGTGANIDNATRQNVRRFRDATRNLTPAERAAADRTIRGTPGQNALRAVGRLSPEGGTVPAVTSLITGPLSGGTIPAVGFAARRIADAITRRNVQELRSLIASGGQDVAAEIEQQLIRNGADDLRSQLANDLSVASGVQGTDRRGSVTVEVVGHPEYGVGASRR